MSIPIAYLTANEAAAAARVSRLKIDQAIASGHLRAYDRTPESTRRHYVIRTPDLDAWICADYPVEPAE